MLLKIRVNCEVQLDHGLLPVLLAPMPRLRPEPHYLALEIDAVHRLHIQVVYLHQVLLELGLGHVGLHSEVHPILLGLLGRPEQHHLVVDELLLLSWLLEVTSDSRLVALRVHVLFPFESFLIVPVELGDVLGGGSVLRSFKIAK